MGRVVKGLALSAVVSSVVMAGGYKLPEQSVNSMGLAAAYVAHTMGADTAYYNPANMSFMADKNFIEGGITLAHLPSNVYTLGGPASGESKVENLLIPNMHYVAPSMGGLGDFRWGVSLVVPGGLTKRWETPFQKASAEEFTLKVIEVNPSIAYKVTDNFSVAAGVRVIYSEGIVKSNSADATAFGAPSNVARDMEGDTIEFGYNLALAYKPTSDINFAITYRSNIDLKEEGKATLSFGGVADPEYNAEVIVPLPATLNIAISKTWNDRFTLEFDYERAFWSKYKNLDFNYDAAIANPVLAGAFDAPAARNWKDVNIFRVGATIKMDNKLTALFGFSVDNSPVPEETIGFELPDSDSKNFSMGFKYQQSKDLSWGAAFLYSSKESISLKPREHEDSNSLLNRGGGFSEGGAFLTTVGVAYEF